MPMVYVGLGSNLAGPVEQVRRALVELNCISCTRRIMASSLYRSAPLGPANQPNYVNAVAQLETGLPPVPLLDALQAIEQRHGRTRLGERWGPRTLDLDLLLYGSDVLHVPGLAIPHPRLAQRAFVLLPLQEIAPDLHVPGRGSLPELLAGCSMGGVVRVDAGPPR